MSAPVPHDSFAATVDAASRLVHVGQTNSVQFAVARSGRPYVVERLVDHAGVRPGTEQVDWLCAGKPILAYTAVHAVLGAGWSVDADIGPLVPATRAWRPVTLRELLTYRSGLVMAGAGDQERCTEDPPLVRRPGWDAAVDAAYTNAGWELLPAVVSSATGADFTSYLVDDVLAGIFGATGSGLLRGAGSRYRDRAFINNPRIGGVFLERTIATAMTGTLADLARFLLGVALDLTADGVRGGAARLLVSANPGPDFFRSGVSARRRWALGFSHRLVDQGFEAFAPADAFGSQGAVLALVDGRMRYAWVVVSAAFPALGAACAVAMDGLRPVPDDRYRLMVATILDDLQQTAPVAHTRGGART